MYMQNKPISSDVIRLGQNKLKYFFTFTIQIKFYNLLSTFIEPASSVLEMF